MQNYFGSKKTQISMEKSTFYSKIQNPGTYTLEEKLAIQNEKTHFPYCALLQQMDLLSDKAASIYQWEERFVPRVSLYMPQPERLRALLDGVEVIDIATPDQLKMKQQIEERKRKEFSTDEPDAFDVMSEINSYQDVSFKTAPKSEILSKFLEAGNVQPTSNTGSEPLPTENIAKKSNSLNETIETETMAVIFEKQGKIQQAIDIYMKLISKNPEKSSTFAVRIEELKTKLETK